MKEAEEASASMALLCPDTRGRAPCEEIVELSGIRGYFVTPAQKRIPGRFLIADFLEINLSLAKERFSLDFVTAAGIPRTRTSFFGETCNARGQTVSERNTLWKNVDFSERGAYTHHDAMAPKQQ